jgi:hypothetical protein
VFLHPIGSTGHVVHFGASGPQNINTIFFILEWAQCSLHEKRTGTRYSELEFLHPVGSAGHVVHSIASGTQNVDGLFFMLRWACAVFQCRTFIFGSGGICGSHVAFWCVPGMKRRRTIFHARLDPVPFP